MFKLGLIINPIAGIGGSVALKGSDGSGISEQAIALGATPKSNQRTRMALEILTTYISHIQIYTAAGSMGESTAKHLGFSTEIVYAPSTLDRSFNDTLPYTTPNDLTLYNTTSDDTKATVKALLAEHVDLILFAGGDGTARDIASIVDDSCPVLGIPAGCKIHSGVYAVTPKAAGRVVELMVTNQLVSLTEADVMDIDESLFRDGVVKAKRFGQMKVPAQLAYIQAVKSGGKESDELVLHDIAAYVIDQMEDELFIIGSGSTTAYLMDELGLRNTLLGVDVIQDNLVIAHDITEPDLWSLIQIENLIVKLVITLIGGQGHIFGRGNQQLSPRIISAIGKDNIMVVATKSKLTKLNNRPLIVDTGDSEVDQLLSGYITVTTGYNDHVLYPVASPQ